jgi:predicted component of type VI protein secretion system
VYTAGERVFVRTLKINLYQLILFEDRYFGFMAIGANHQFLTHLITAFRGPMREL